MGTVQREPTPRWTAESLRRFAAALLEAEGLPQDRASDVGDVLLEGDLLGHDTHGLHLLSLYLREIRDGRMPAQGEPMIIAEHDDSLSWNGGYLPGPWLIRRAIERARNKLVGRSCVTVTIARSHHIACLQAYLKPVTDAGLIIVLASTDPGNRWVAPHGAVEPVYSPNPIAAGIPTSGTPVLIDISTSTTAAGQCMRAANAGEKLPGPWVIDEEGRATDDPQALVREHKGALLPLGGTDLGYKGFGLALLLEALTSGLGGHGRATGDARWGCSVFLQLIDPARFGGTDSFLRETSFLADACRRARVPAGKPPVRTPGERALAQREERLAHGVGIRRGVMQALEPWAREHGVPLPPALA